VRIEIRQQAALAEKLTYAMPQEIEVEASACKGQRGRTSKA